MRQINSTGKGPNAIGPYSQAVRGGNSYSLADKSLSTPPRRRSLTATSVNRLSESCKVLRGSWRREASSMSEVVRCVVYLKNMSDFEAMNEVYGRIFDAPLPARTAVGGAR